MSADRHVHLQAIAETALRTSGMHDAGLYLLKPGGALDEGVVVGMPPAFAKTYEAVGARVDTVLHRLLATRRPCSTVLCFGDRFKEMPIYKRVSGRFGLEGYATIPLFEREALTGVLFLGAATPATAARLDTEGLLDLSSLAARVSTALQAMPRPAPQLTPRQHEVAALAAEGMTNREIAATLGSGEASVRKHLKALNRIYGVSNRTAMAARWRRGYPNGD